jgi:hypothetical protein
LNQTGHRRNRHIRRESAHQEQINVFGLDFGPLKATDRRFVAQITRGLMRQYVAALQDAGPLDDPFGITAETLMQMVVGNDGIGNVTTGGDDPQAH